MMMMITNKPTKAKHNLTGGGNKNAAGHRDKVHGPLNTILHKED